MRFYFSPIVLACCSFPAMAQDALVWGSGNWGSSIWSSVMPAVSIPSLSFGGLTSLIILMATLPFLPKIKRLTKRRS